LRGRAVLRDLMASTTIAFFRSEAFAVDLHMLSEIIVPAESLSTVGIETFVSWGGGKPS
jgi:hypothetical protein